MVCWCVHRCDDRSMFDVTVYLCTVIIAVIICPGNIHRLRISRVDI